LGVSATVTMALTSPELKLVVADIARDHPVLLILPW
jgi:hypothetical protein